ncbi:MULTISPECIES: hypothetical protein [unclassified Streptomyces]|uniref:hypothetical protein n=1 Tax=unclassified Streptomyces TaxID=2593676 RepID=UPI002251123B|nr:MULTISPECIES: hypothetical protein [unclassified Streptomyces]MCX5327873.1 hypothetical protein [Streptomyces sp. NBC_00140]MCX5357362.1 hypothetical protein [Streptomyces sp. NBC_00124]
MTTDHHIADLDECSLILALQEVTENLTAATGSESLPKDRDEAHDLLAALLRAGGIDDAAELAPLDEPGQYAAARRVLAELARDPATRAVAEPVLADPPADTRLGAELVVPSLATMAGLVTWLQTKVDVRIKRKDGKTEFEFRVMKEVAPAAMLKGLAAAVARLWNGSPPQ